MQSTPLIPVAVLQAEADEKERRKREKMEAHLYTILKVARDSDFRHQIGNNQFFDLVDHDKVCTHRIRACNTQGQQTVKCVSITPCIL